ncbi:MAG TPA: zinc ribbon domain-containing protein [Clostridia bacterium]|nr:zinc ribbon domain-containing protein [Clostridia bacterium]
MSFCTSCGTKIEPTSQFCTGCGTKTEVGQKAANPSTQAAATPVAAAQPTVAPPAVQPVVTKSSSPVVKIVIIVVVILVGLGIVSAAITGYMAYKVKKAIGVDAAGNVTSVDTPFGKISSETNAGKVAENLGIAIYPGAKALEGASAGTFGNVSFGGAEFETSDPMDKVAQFYKNSYPKAAFAGSDENNFSMMVGTPDGLITIALESSDGKTIIRLGKTTADGSSSSSSAEE